MNISVNKNSAIIIGGTGQYGITLGNLLIKKKYNVIATGRNLKKITLLKKKFPKITFIKLDLYNKKKIKELLRKLKPNLLFYFAGQSSPSASFRIKKETLKSNFNGCKIFLDIIRDEKLKIKFINAASSEMYGRVKKKIDLQTLKQPLNPYGYAKKKSFELVKEYRDKFGMKNYNAIMFNTESALRDKQFLIAKICLGAINAFNKNEKLVLNNTIVSREWNWCAEQCSLMIKFLSKKPQDFILSNGKAYSIKQMLNFAFGYFNLNYKNFVVTKFKKLNKNEVKEKKSDFRKYLKKNQINFKSKIFGKRLIIKMIKNYLNDK